MDPNRKVNVPAGTIERLALKLAGEKSWVGFRPELRKFYEQNVVNLLMELSILLDEPITIEYDAQISTEHHVSYKPLQLDRSGGRTPERKVDIGDENEIDWSCLA